MNKYRVFKILRSTLPVSKGGERRPNLFSFNKEIGKKEKDDFKKKMRPLLKEVVKLWLRKLEKDSLKMILYQLYENAFDVREFGEHFSHQKTIILAEVFCQPGTVESAITKLIYMIEEKITGGKDYFFETKYFFDEDNPPKKIFFKKFDSINPHFQLNQLIVSFFEMP